jgi:hypothetical protein
LKTSKVLAVIVLLDALYIAVGHVPLSALFFSSLTRPAGPGLVGPAEIGGYFVFATVVFALGGIFVAWGKLFKLANVGLIILAVVDNALLVYTRTMPNFFFRRIIPWSWTSYPVGTGQIFICQAILVVLCAILIYNSRTTKAQQPLSSTHP